MTVEEILRSKGHAVVTVRPDATVAEAAGLLERHRIGALVVSSDGRRVDGLLGESDVVRAVARNGASALQRQVGTVMAHDAVTCTAGDRVTKVMALMTDRRQRHVPVVRDGELEGIVSIGDLVKARLSELELESRVLRDAWLVRH